MKAIPRLDSGGIEQLLQFAQLIFERLGEAPSGLIATGFQGQTDPAGGRR